jgi:hypothetical protein
MVLGPRDLYVGRGRGRVNLQTAKIGEQGWFGNPFESKIFGLDQCIEMYAKAFISKIQADPEFAAAVAALDVDNVYCWCKLDKNCHGDFIVAYLEER